MELIHTAGDEVFHFLFHLELAWMARICREDAENEKYLTEIMLQCNVSDEIQNLQKTVPKCLGQL